MISLYKSIKFSSQKAIDCKMPESCNSLCIYVISLSTNSLGYQDIKNYIKVYGWILILNIDLQLVKHKILHLNVKFWKNHFFPKTPVKCMYQFNMSLSFYMNTDHMVPKKEFWFRMCQ